jgi:hypothetical protein
MTDIRILKGGKRPEDVTSELAERIADLIYEYRGRITLAATLGVLQIVADGLLRDHD